MVIGLRLHKSAVCEVKWKIPDDNAQYCAIINVSYSKTLKEAIMTEPKNLNNDIPTAPHPNLIPLDNSTQCAVCNTANWVVKGETPLYCTNCRIWLHEACKSVIPFKYGPAWFRFRRPLASWRCPRCSKMLLKLGSVGSGWLL